MTVSVVPEANGALHVPSPEERRTVPFAPTAKTWLGSLPQIPSNVCPVPLFWAAQVFPWFAVCRIVPLAPTAYTSPAKLPQTACKLLGVLLCWVTHFNGCAMSGVGPDPSGPPSPGKLMSSVP